MKKMLMTLILAVSAVSAFATEMPLRNVRLELKMTPIAGFKGETITIDILENGAVYGKRKLPGRPALPVQFDRLSLSEIGRIDSLIEDARYVSVLPPNPNEIICRALSTHGRTLFADNDRVFLQSGPVPCGHQTRNASPATEDLLRIANEEYAKFLRMN
jgi:hypothetical protein